MFNKSKKYNYEQINTYHSVSTEDLSALKPKERKLKELYPNLKEKEIEKIIHNRSRGNDTTSTTDDYNPKQRHNQTLESNIFNDPVILRKLFRKKAFIREEMGRKVRREMEEVNPL